MFGEIVFKEGKEIRRIQGDLDLESLDKNFIIICKEIDNNKKKRYRIPYHKIIKIEDMLIGGNNE